MQAIRVIDSHTAGEPTRVVIEGGPELASADAKTQREILRTNHDEVRSALCNEPRGFDAVVGAFLLPPHEEGSLAQVIFFNNVGYLGMCVHGTIGVAETLRHLGRATTGRHQLETPVGPVTIEYRDDGSIAVENVESYRHLARVPIQLDGETIHGDVAWGGNWFLLVSDHGQELATTRIPELLQYTSRVRRAMIAQGVTGANGAEIDHIELFGPAIDPKAQSRNFVLCPGLEYDRSPCGTGTSAKLACLAADEVLTESETWCQESILGTHFHGTIRKTARGVIPTLRGRAWVTGDNRLLFDPTDPFRNGIVK
jgi:proline racemase